VPAAAQGATEPVACDGEQQDRDHANKHARDSPGKHVSGAVSTTSTASAVEDPLVDVDVDR
jgi:hypothetical protein